MQKLRPIKRPVAGATFPSAGIEAWYRAQLDAVLREMNDSLVLHIGAAWKRDEPSIGFAADASPTVALRRALAKWGGLWTQKINDLSDTLSKKFALKNYRYTDASMREAFRKAGFSVKFKPTVASVEAYRTVAAENVNLIKSIPQQYLKDVQTSVWSSVMVGGDQYTLAKKIDANYRVGRRRAALIARDQNNKAKAVMENTRRRELGITEAVWLHSHAGITPRPTHVAMHGKTYKTADGMYDSDEGKNVWPGELINCRCSSKPIIPGVDLT